VKFFEPRHYPSPGCHCQQFNISAGHPPNSSEFILEQQVIGFVIKAPLTHDNISPAFFNSLHHLHEIFLFFVG
jgi:hypothetical protein